jgi:cobalt/nickel transport system permease protein
MHHVVVERWSRGVSPLHARDARSKLGAALVFLVALSTTRPGNWIAIACYSALLAIAAIASRLPVHGVILRALLVLPFSATFALLTWWSGDSSRAITLALKAFLSALAALLLVATTPMTELAAALDILRVPRMLVLVIQFLYRYLFVISEQAQHMRLAALSRSGTRRGVRSRFHAAAGALGVLFVRSWERADGIYSAMLARGFRGQMHPVTRPHFHRADYAFLALAVSACIAIRLAL